MLKLGRRKQADPMLEMEVQFLRQRTQAFSILRTPNGLKTKYKYLR